MAASPDTATAAKHAIPRAPEFDGTLALLRDGYDYIARRRHRLGSNVFRTRLMLRDVLCMGGAEAARFFYDGDRFTRTGAAMPGRVVKLLQDKGSVQMLDDAAHRQRKAMFMGLMTEPSIARLTELFSRHWQLVAAQWPQRQPVRLFDEVNGIIARAVCEWTGAPLASIDAGALTRSLSDMIEMVSVLGPAYWQARWRRRQTERWAGSLIEDARAGRLNISPEAPLMRIAQHRDLDGQPLSVEAAAVELINLLRPTVAVGHFIVFAAHALHSLPDLAKGLDPHADRDLEAFAQEVRRYYPFFPFIGGIAREMLAFEAFAIPPGQWVLLDLHGTNHDPQIWPEPNAFRPERFSAWDNDLYTLVPQGAGNVFTGHRCPGERITLELTKKATSLLLCMHYRVPEQDLSIKLNRMPTLPESGFAIDHVRL
ncbi:cytochrome P450 [Rhodoligotrophos defluvii]|uniref:cytochrome P450 n=1 Tax=Rhodoligotrophos defluvii TaxID=2561934 RepID=UPI001960EF53|nr:cytochrome P450 [Rhodoligotrophos defluvii]